MRQINAVSITFLDRRSEHHGEILFFSKVVPLDKLNTTFACTANSNQVFGRPRRDAREHYLCAFVAGGICNSDKVVGLDIGGIQYKAASRICYANQIIDWSCG